MSVYFPWRSLSARNLTEQFWDPQSRNCQILETRQCPTPNNQSKLKTTLHYPFVQVNRNFQYYTDSRSHTALISAFVFCCYSQNLSLRWVQCDRGTPSLWRQALPRHIFQWDSFTFLFKETMVKCLRDLNSWSSNTTRQLTPLISALPGIGLRLKHCVGSVSLATKEDSTELICGLVWVFSCCLTNVCTYWLPNSDVVLVYSSEVFFSLFFFCFFSLSVEVSCAVVA